MPRRIDVHHHALSTPYLEWEKLGKATFRTPLDISKWSLQGCLDDMDKYGIATSIVSWPDLNGNNPGDWLDVVRAITSGWRRSPMTIPAASVTLDLAAAECRCLPERVYLCLSR